MSDEEIDDAVLKVYGIERQKEGKGNAIRYAPRICLRCGAENPSIEECYSRCSTPLDKDKLVDSENKEREVETAIIGSPIVDNSTKKLLKTFDPEFKDKILEDLLTEIIRNPRLKQRFIKALVTKQ